MGDYDKSLDDIIQQRNVGRGRLNNNVGGKKNALSLRPPITKDRIGKGARGGGRQQQQQFAKKKLQRNQNLRIKDAREMLLQKNRMVDAREMLLQKNRVVDARQKLNEKAKMVDAREKLNRKAAQQNKASVFKSLPKSRGAPYSSADLTRTVSNRLNAVRVTNNNMLKKAGKQVVLTDSGLTVITRPPLQRLSAAPTGSIFTRTVDSLTKDVFSQSGLVKTFSKKRQISNVDSNDDSDEYYTERVRPVPKRICPSLPVETVEVNRCISTSLQSRLGKKVGSQQGYRLIVSNLHPRVSERDLEDLFGVVGPIFVAQILEDGIAEVIYQKSPDAEQAVKVYNGRELDGKPMGVKMMNMAATLKPSLTAPQKYTAATGTLHSDNLQEIGAKSRITPDVGLFHKALFRNKSSPVVRSHASFTVTM